jgi:hypothetical protein
LLVLLSGKGWTVGRIAGTFETSTTTVRKYLDLVKVEGVVV